MNDPADVGRIPTSEQLDAGWFTARLREAGLLREAGHRSAEVVSVDSAQIGTGQIGKCVRYRLSLGSADDESTPSSLIGKFPSDDPVSRATGVQLRNYYREVNFYRHIASDLSISIPRCYYADIVDEGPEFILLLEDMHPAEQGDQLTGCTTDVARAAILELVGLQAPTWCRAELERFDWLSGAGDQSRALLDLYGQFLPGFIERYGEALMADEQQILTRVAESPTCPLFQPVGSPFCLEHVDYRLDNLLIDSSQTPPRITVVDWQSVRIGKPMNDVAYFLGAGLLPDARREAEREIVRDYHERLRAAGIDDYSWGRCWEDYRRGSYSGFGVTVIASMLVQRTRRGDEMFIAMARRHTRHALDLGADEFLS